MSVGTRRNGSRRWWPVLSNGRRTRDGSWLWTLHPPLCEALIAAGWVDDETPISDGQLLPTQPPGRLREGRKQEVLLTRYERHPIARRRCLAHYGHRCTVCGFEAERVFGREVPAAIHVHHLRPIASMGGEYELDPINDLRPVCANCHAVIHSYEPLVHPDDLAKHFRARAASS